jgi:hypothetical protein
MAVLTPRSTPGLGLVGGGQLNLPDAVSGTRLVRGLPCPGLPAGRGAYNCATIPLCQPGPFAAARAILWPTRNRSNGRDR